MTDTTVLKKRILVALDAFQDYQTLLDIAVSLAEHQSAALSALFVEDINLFHLAGLPFAMEIDRMFSTEQQLDEMKMTRNMENRLRRIRRALSDVNKQLRLQVSLTVVRGNYLTEALAAAAEVDLLLLENPGKRPARTGKTASKELFIRPVWVVYDGSPAADRSLDIAGEILKNRHAELNVVLKIQKGKDCGELKKKLQEKAAAFHAKAHFFVMEEENGFPSIMQNVLQKGSSIIIVNRELGESAETRKMAALISEAAGCPLLLVS
ncbi:MAG: universal stress protein [Gammaproteobacteria bacterium]